MGSNIRDRIVSDMKECMKSQQKERLATIRLIMAALKQREVDERIELTDEHVLATLNKMLKQRRDSISQYTTASRMDLVEQEQAEVTVIQQYLPEQLSESDIQLAIDQAITKTGASSLKDMGKIMGALKEALQGRADMSLVNQLIKAKFN